jgi:hypothetical protein
MAPASDARQDPAGTHATSPKLSSRGRDADAGRAPQDGLTHWTAPAMPRRAARHHSMQRIWPGPLANTSSQLPS